MMGESDRELMRQLAENSAEISKRVFDMHGITSAIGEQVDAFIQSQKERDREHETRANEHSRRIDDSAGKILAYEAQLRLVKWVLGFVGTGGFIAAIAAVAKAVAK